MKNNFKVDNLQVSIFDSAPELGVAAADFVSDELNKAIDSRGSANLILATGASQFPFIEALKKKDLDWSKVVVFHLDEYKGISDTHPASFRKYLRERILDEVKPKEVYYLNGDAEDTEGEVKRYEEKLKEHPIDIACVGIGENGHLAFNDPPVADFNDPKLVKVVELDEACRNQQLGEGWFSTFDEVPKEAITLTISAIMNCNAISCVVPDERKAEAVYNTLYGDIDTKCPGSILRKHPKTILFLDKGSSSKLKA